MKKIIVLLICLLGFSTFAQAQSIGVVFTRNLSNSAFLQSNDLPFGVQLGATTGGLRLRASNLISNNGAIGFTTQLDFLLSLFRTDPIEFYFGIGANGAITFVSSSLGAIIGAEGIVGLAFNFIPNLSIFAEVNVVKYIIGVGSAAGTNASALPLGFGLAVGLAINF